MPSKRAYCLRANGGVLWRPGSKIARIEQKRKIASPAARVSR
jgi:hypothetical protein